MTNPKHDLDAIAQDVSLLAGRSGVTVHAEVETCRLLLRRPDDPQRVRVTRFESGELLVKFSSTDELLCEGRTHGPQLAVEGAAQWLVEGSVENLRATFSWVDPKLRALRELERSLLANHPRLGAIEAVMAQVPESPCLVMSGGGDRAVTFAKRLVHSHPTASFHWQGAWLFDLVEPAVRVGPVVERWLVDEAVPSSLSAEFDWLDVGPLAPWYEAGRGLEGEFVTSWAWVREFFESFGWDFVPRMLALIDDLIARGYDHTLRAGQSLSTFIVSRSRQHGLEAGDSWVSFDCLAPETVVEWRLGAAQGRETVPAGPANPRVLDLLDVLAAVPCD